MKENFLQRWSRLKRDPPLEAAADTENAAASPASTDLSCAAAAQPLPALDTLEFSSDFTAFMGDQVAHRTRRVALQKLFQAEHFNVMDGLDVYVENYNSFEPIGEEMLRNLNQARGLLFDDEELVAAAPDADIPEEAPRDEASVTTEASEEFAYPVDSGAAHGKLTEEAP